MELTCVDKAERLKVTGKTPCFLRYFLEMLPRYTAIENNWCMAPSHEIFAILTSPTHPMAWSSPAAAQVHGGEGPGGTAAASERSEGMRLRPQSPTG